MSATYFATPGSDANRSMGGLKPVHTTSLSHGSWQFWAKSRVNSGCAAPAPLPPATNWLTGGPPLLYQVSASDGSNKSALKSHGWRPPVTPDEQPSLNTCASAL